MQTQQQAIAQTKKWIEDVVVACNFCPFAAKEIKRNAIHYQVETATDIKHCLAAFIDECMRLDNTPEISTTLIIFTQAFTHFNEYLKAVSLAEKLLAQKGYEGVYQVASFHPQYQFAGSDTDDAANFTNRSVYPMLHLLREDYIEEALLRYPNAELIPQHNIDFARKKGAAYMQMLRDSCL